jgi:REP element-mobilizing transposase RayT
MPSTPKETALVHGECKPRFGTVNIRDRGRLPHWETESGVYFLTFRLADSLPQPVLEKIKQRKLIAEAAARSGRKLLKHEVKLLEEVSAKKIEEYLDAGEGACYLRNPRIAQLVADALCFFEGKRYRHFAWCVMPNHVHSVFRALPGFELPEIVRSWKGFSSRMANRILNRSGVFWEREYYDHLIRDNEELERAVKYVKDNPARAGLKNWKWVWCAEAPIEKS